MVAAIPILLAFTLLLQTGVDAPRAEVRGPKTICFRYSSFALDAGERIESEQMGLHGVVVRIEGPSGSYQVSENEAYRTPARPGTRVYQEGDTSIFRSRARPFSYAFFAPTGFSPDRPRMIAVISGAVLSGGRGDASFYRRLTIADPSRMRCDHSYLYGFDAVLGNVR
ncbi:hypothetical protein [Brevundimonas sp.]|uniref:hypothetical protein n=1 Tax=Brevundimonas sp. TaxID=1871086 RepID=UPI002CFBA030|nr:hypothetical protein [Brevundimonas sp.]HWQ86172.1 hypothetical protein [Brevundimonas sp.]